MSEITENNQVNQTPQEYENLHKISRDAQVLSSISQLLDWDHETYMPADRSMPAVNR